MSRTSSLYQALVVLLAISVHAVICEEETDYQQEGTLEDYNQGSFKRFRSIKCFACTSYVPQCRTTVNETEGSVSNVGCKTKCFLREGEEKDPAWYRGCMDDYKDVLTIAKDYTGCRYQTWNGRKRLWCLCDSDMCNGVSIKSLAMGLTVSEKAYDPAPMRQGVAYNTYSQYKPKARGHKYEHVAKYGREAPKAEWVKKQLFEEMAYNQKVAEQNNDLYQNLETPSYNEQKVYTDIEQVHYGQSNDIFVNPSGKTEETNNGATKRQVEGSLVKQPYYPFPEEGKDQAYLAGRYSEEKQEDGYKYEQQYVYEDPQATQSDPSPNENTEVYLEEKPYDPSEDLARLAEKVLCDRTGFIPNPEDCSKFLACIMDSHIGKPVMYPMRCPAGLFWDNKVRVCVSTSSTCEETLGIDYDDQTTIY